MHSVTITHRLHFTRWRFALYVETTDPVFRSKWNDHQSQLFSSYCDARRKHLQDIEDIEDDKSRIFRELVDLRKQSFRKFFTLRYYKEQWRLEMSRSDLESDHAAVIHRLNQLDEILDLENLSASTRHLYKLLNELGYYLHQKGETRGNQFEIWHKS